ncbi:MAG: cysteine desulfurase family protein [Candidatus Humimicrobiia bacterium]
MDAYLDYQSAKPVDLRVIEAMTPYFYDKFGNPSSLHKIGDEATKVLEESRQTIANFINAEKDEIIFTSGATESNNLAIIGFALRNKEKGNHIIISEIEHISIHNIAKYLVKNGFDVSKVPVDQYGRVNLSKIKERINGKTILISIGYANNEIGTIQKISGIGKLCKEYNIVFHSDAVAAEGLIPIDVKNDNIDLLTLSSNDIYGPKGLGILFVRKGIRLSPIIIGGGQERGLRSGSENITGIVAMAKATEIMEKEMDKEVKRFKVYQDKIIKNILSKIPRSYLNGHPTERLANNVHFRFEGIEGEALLLSLKDKGISVSTGSACTSKTLEPSHTLISLGLLHEEAHGSLEITFGRFTKKEDIDSIIKVLPKVVEKLRNISPLYK